MIEEEIKTILCRLLKNIAPETEPEKLLPDEDIRHKLEIDSFDALRFVVSVNEELGIEIPEQDYGKISTMKELINYICERKK